MHQKYKVDVQAAIKSAQIQMKKDSKELEDRIRLATDEVKRKMNIPVIYNGGNKSIWWWKNKLTVLVHVNKESVIKQFTKKEYEPVIEKVRRSCTGMWEICYRPDVDLFGIPKNPSLTIMFSSKSDATYFKLLWS